MIIPSIDLMNGKAVQLVQGKKKVLERENVLELARELGRYGEIAVIDLDAALGKGNNIQLIKQICKVADCRVGGGIRSLEKATEILRAGAKKIIIGTMAKPEFLKNFPKGRVIVAVDTRKGYVVNNGWRKGTKKKPEEMIKALEKYCCGFLFTDVEREGLMRGCDFEKIAELRNLTSNKITVAGGISSVLEIKKLEGLGVDFQIGMAIYTGKINLGKAFISLLDFEKNNGLIPTIVQDNRKQVLMLAFSSKESLLKSLETGKATYYSRSRKRLWTKGETSGNSQYLIRVKYDCDKDALLFTVKQRGYACHSGGYSCFGEGEFGIEELYDVIRERVINPRQSSYTSRISGNENRIKEKIREECEEVLNYTDRENLIQEIADLAYFVKILMAKKGISPVEIRNELWRRSK